jgi:hypothetical protein
MRAATFCMDCGERLASKGWRVRLGRPLCDRCAQRLGMLSLFRPLLAAGILAVIAFTIGKYPRPAPPPLIIQRAANSPLSDLPVNMNDPARVDPRAHSATVDTKQNVAPADEVVYICGARTKKGTPCHRRVHAAGERCFQHKGMPSLVPLSKLVIRP